MQIVSLDILAKTPWHIKKNSTVEGTTFLSLFLFKLRRDRNIVPAEEPTPRPKPA